MQNKDQRGEVTSQGQQLGKKPDRGPNDQFSVLEAQLRLSQDCGPLAPRALLAAPVGWPASSDKDGPPSSESLQYPQKWLELRGPEPGGIAEHSLDSYKKYISTRL